MRRLMVVLMLALALAGCSASVSLTTTGPMGSPTPAAAGTESSATAGLAPNTVYVPPAGALAASAVLASGLQGGAGQNGIAIGYGPASAPLKLSVFEDFRCPICDEMEKAGLGVAMQQYARDGKLQIQYHVASFIDDNDGGSGSHQAANAAACAQDAGPGDFVAFHNVLYANQPQETDDAFADPRLLVALAQRVPGLATPAFVRCLTGDTHAGWVTAAQTDFNRRGITGTPTVVLDGTPVAVTASSQADLADPAYSPTTGVMTVAAFEQVINAELVRKGIAPETPTATGIPAA